MVVTVEFSYGRLQRRLIQGTNPRKARELVARRRWLPNRQLDGARNCCSERSASRFGSASFTAPLAERIGVRAGQRILATRVCCLRPNSLCRRKPKWRCDSLCPLLVAEQGPRSSVVAA